MSSCTGGDQLLQCMLGSLKQHSTVFTHEGQFICYEVYQKQMQNVFCDSEGRFLISEKVNVLSPNLNR